jgi:hypothetical protein
VGLPAATAPAGGRFTPDVVGAKISQNVLDIIHVEVGQLAYARGRKNL